MTVWLVKSGCRYEGSCVISIHMTEEGGRAAALVEIKNTADFYDYKEQRTNYWIDGSDFVMVEAHKVKP